MTEPSKSIPVDDVGNETLKAVAALRELRRAVIGESVDEARRRSCEAIRLQKLLLTSSRRATDAVVAKQNGDATARGIAKIEAKPGRPLTQGEMPTFLKGLAKGLMEWLTPELTKLEKRIAELEARPSLKYRGVFSEQETYNVGDFCTFQGGLWHCQDANRGVRPGTGSSWKLAVKKGGGK